MAAIEVVQAVAPAGEACIDGHDQAAALVVVDQQSEEEAGLLARERTIPQFIENQQARRRELTGASTPAGSLAAPGSADSSASLRSERARRTLRRWR